MNLNCIIIDDEPIAQNILKGFIKNTPELTLFKTCDNALDALSFLKEKEIDLIFLDIEMPLINGLKFLSILENPPATIFTTAYRNFALESYELNAVDYLLKPFSFDRFLKAVQKVYKKNPKNSSNADFHYFKVDRKYVKISYGDITYVEGLSNYVIIHTLSQQYVVYHRLKDMEKLLPEENFARIHRSFIISLLKMKAYGSDYVEIADRQLSIGNSYRESFFKKV